MKSLQKLLMGSMFLFLFSGNNSYCDGDYEDWGYDKLKQELKNSVTWIGHKIESISEDIEQSDLMQSTKNNLLMLKDEIKDKLKEIKNDIDSFSSEELIAKIHEVTENINQKFENLLKNYRNSKSVETEEFIV